MSANDEWPPVSGDFEVGTPSHCVAICTLGKKISVDTEYAIIGPCKTENIGIERVIINIISNPNIRFLILSGPEVPGHLTGRSLRALYNNGVDPQTIDMINTTDPTKIAAAAKEMSTKNPGVFAKGAMWVEFRVTAKKAPRRRVEADVILLPEYGVIFESNSSLVTSHESKAIVTEHPSLVVIEVQDDETGTILFGREV